MHAVNGDKRTQRIAHNNPIGMATSNRANSQKIVHNQPQFAMIIIIHVTVAYGTLKRQ